LSASGKTLNQSTHKANFTGSVSTWNFEYLEFQKK